MNILSKLPSRWTIQSNANSMAATVVSPRARGWTDDELDLAFPAAAGWDLVTKGTYTRPDVTVHAGVNVNINNITYFKTLVVVPGKFCADYITQQPFHTQGTKNED